ncbi:MAG: hypothetical protein M1823_001360 [Watsoniomyces obsoletus]|nr:MAG: hypothetical protein M1823_001360 [Watsoniomyces obsoletus]
MHFIRLQLLLACPTTFLTVWGLPQSHLQPLPPDEGDETVPNTDVTDINNNVQPSPNIINTSPPNTNNQDKKTNPNTGPQNSNQKQAELMPLGQTESNPLGTYLLAASGAVGGLVLGHLGTRFLFNKPSSSSSPPSSSADDPTSKQQDPPRMTTDEERAFWKNWKPGDGGIDFSHRNKEFEKLLKEKENERQRKLSIIVEKHAYEGEFKNEKEKENSFMRCMKKHLGLLEFDKPQSIVIPASLWNPFVETCGGFERWKLNDGKGIIVTVWPVPKLKSKTKTIPGPKLKKSGAEETDKKTDKTVYLNPGRGQQGEGHEQGYQGEHGRRRKDTNSRDGNGNGNGNGRKQVEHIQEGVYRLTQGERLLSLTKVDGGGIVKGMKENAWKGTMAALGSSSPRMVKVGVPKGVVFIP